MPRVLGLDPSLRLGWAVLGPGLVRVAAGDVRLDLITGRGARGRRVWEALDTIGELIELYRPARVAYELVPLHRSFKSGDACLAYASMAACVEAAAERLGVPVVRVPAAHAKKLATGRGNAPKADVRRAAEARWGPTGSEDEADALWVAAAASAPSADPRRVADLLDT